MGGTPPQLYVLIKVLKHPALVNEYFHKGPICSRGHRWRRNNEQWCAYCALSIIKGHLGPSSSQDIKGDYFSPYLKWTQDVHRLGVKDCWRKSTRPTSSTHSLISYRKPSPLDPDRLSPGKIAYTLYWGDTGTLRVDRMCLDPYCVNPFHLYSPFNYIDQEVIPSDLFKIDGATKQPFDFFMRFGSRDNAVAPVHEFIRALISPKYFRSHFEVGYPCPWGHKIRHKKDQWCFECVKRITSNECGFDINYLESSYRWYVKDYFRHFIVTPFKFPRDNECWEYPKDQLKATYKLPNYAALDGDVTSVSFPKLIYTLFWGDVGKCKVVRTCKNKRCFNPNHYRSCFNCPEDEPVKIKCKNFDLQVTEFTKIAKRRKRYAGQDNALPLPWQALDILNSPPASGDTTSKAEVAHAASKTNNSIL